MKHYILDDHNKRNCPDAEESSAWEEFCRPTCHKTHCVIWKGGEFVILTYHECLHFGAEHDFILKLLHNTKKQKSIYNEFYCFKSYKIEHDIDAIKKRRALDTDTCLEFNYLYKSMTARYAITTIVPKSLMIKNAVNIQQEYKDTVDYLKDIGMDEDSSPLFYDLWELTKLNDCIWLLNDKQIHRSIDAFIKEVNQVTK